MNKFMAVLEYDGTLYHGWQLQKELPTVQGAVEAALERILRRPTRVYGSGRTDAGVHGRGQVAHFVAEWNHPESALKNALNAMLPRDVSVRALAPAAEDFHARHSALSKTYVYRILNGPTRSPLLRYYSLHVPDALDLPSMREASALLIGSHDFAAFGNPTDGTTSTVREILGADWSLQPDNGLLVFTIRGTGFLRYMVRSLVGTLLLVGRGKITPADFGAILESRNRSRSGPTAAPHGLCLESVEYMGEDCKIWTSGQTFPVRNSEEGAQCFNPPIWRP